MRAAESPVQVLQNVIVVTLQVDLSANVISHLNSRVLDVLQTTKLRWVIMDLSGMDIIDDREFAELIKLRDKIKLMGATTIFAGLKPQVIVALDTLGTDLSDIKSARDLDQALQLAGV
ncbi:MAG: STAS domain-containing protein [Gammaproteobacteria bacterium]